jgi:TRAP-type C4-dicarboxylate transport system permease large subunit
MRSFAPANEDARAGATATEEVIVEAMVGGAVGSARATRGRLGDGDVSMYTRRSYPKKKCRADSTLTKIP